MDLVLFADEYQSMTLLQYKKSCFPWQLQLEGGVCVSVRARKRKWTQAVSMTMRGFLKAVFVRFLTSTAFPLICETHFKCSSFSYFLNVRPNSYIKSDCKDVTCLAPDIPILKRILSLCYVGSKMLSMNYAVKTLTLTNKNGYRPLGCNVSWTKRRQTTIAYVKMALVRETAVSYQYVIKLVYDSVLFIAPAGRITSRPTDSL